MTDDLITFISHFCTNGRRTASVGVWSTSSGFEVHVSFFLLAPKLRRPSLVRSETSESTDFRSLLEFAGFFIFAVSHVWHHNNKNKTSALRTSQSECCKDKVGGRLSLSAGKITSHNTQNISYQLQNITSLE